MGKKSDLALEALGNDVRRDILRMLAEGPKSVAELSAPFPISRPAISRHLAQLVEAGLATYTSRGTRNVYSIATQGFTEARSWLDGFWDEAEPRIKLLAENTAPLPNSQLKKARYEDLTEDLFDQMAAENNNEK